jgi:hypothetical protein
MENLIKHLIYIIFLCIANSINSQCWEIGQAPNGYKINTVYTLDSLVVSENAFAVLNHSIALTDSLEFDTQETWLYFVISIRSSYNKADSTLIRIELNQGVEVDILNNYFFEGVDKFSGAFCYRGYTFFTICENDDVPICEDLFKANNEKDFYVYFKSPFVSNKWKEVGYDFMVKYIFLFYYYYEGKFYYSNTKIVE